MIRMALAHLLSTTRALVSRRSAVLIIVLLALAAAFFWPDPSRSSLDGWADRAADEEQGIAFVLSGIGLIWLTFLPVLLSMSVRLGACRGQSVELGALAHPALPLSPRWRMILEAFLALALVGIGRIPFVILRDVLIGESGQYPAFLVGSFFQGALVLLPVVLVCFARTRVEEIWLRAIVFGIIVLSCAISGTMASWPGLVLVSGLLCVVALLLDGVTLRPRNGLAFGVYPLSRAARNPVERLRSDFVTRPIPMIAIFVLAELFVVAGRWYGILDGMSFYLASTFLFSFSVGMITLRPFASSQAIAGIWGKAGYRCGDFGRAFATLPVPRDLVIRTTYLYAFITGAATWLAIVLVAGINARVATGEFLLFVDSDGRLVAEILLPMLALIPCAAGYVVEGSFGERPPALFMGGMLVLAPQMVLILLVFRAPNIAIAVVSIAIGLVGGLFPLRHLREGAPVAEAY